MENFAKNQEIEKHIIPQLLPKKMQNENFLKLEKIHDRVQRNFDNSTNLAFNKSTKIDFCKSEL